MAGQKGTIMPFIILAIKPESFIVNFLNLYPSSTLPTPPKVEG